MNPKLNCEYPDPDEAQLIAAMVKLAVAPMKPEQGRIRRGQHAKATSCVRGEFTIRTDVPAALRHGVFRQPGQTFQAMIRFSNSSDTLAPDTQAAARGLAIKLLAVAGPPASAGSQPHCQDFLTVNLPVFPFANPAEYVKFFDLRTAPVVGDALAAAWFAVFHPRHLASLAGVISETVASPLVKYWSGSPYWLGPPGTTGGHAVKYSLVPLFEKITPLRDPHHQPDDYLSQALAQHLKTRAVVFEFRVQLQTDPVAMPVEDVSVEWDETVSIPIPVATLTIGVQDLDSSEGRALDEEGEVMAFSPWNALAEHRPMGGINRMRQAVYLASQAERAQPADLI